MRILIGLGIALAIFVVGTNVVGESGTEPIKKPAEPAYSLTSPSSPWVVVNKNYPLKPKSYAPTNLVTPDVPLRDNITKEERLVSERIKVPLEKLVAAAKVDDLELNLQSGYRSYDFQVNLYDSYVEAQGKATADKYSAQPGYSEHQTGLAVDLGGTTNPDCDVTDCFGDTPEAAWIAKHAHEYGFIVRYQPKKQKITGYEYEPWHLRYVGKELAVKIYKQDNITLEEYFKQYLK